MVLSYAIYMPQGQVFTANAERQGDRNPQAYFYIFPKTRFTKMQTKVLSYSSFNQNKSISHYLIFWRRIFAAKKILVSKKQFKCFRNVTVL